MSLSYPPQDGSGIACRPAPRGLDIFSGEWAIGRIYEERGTLPEPRWQWFFHGGVSRPPDMVADGREPTLEVAKVQFAENWRKWMAWWRSQRSRAVSQKAQDIAKKAAASHWLEIKNSFCIIFIEKRK